MRHRIAQALLLLLGCRIGECLVVHAPLARTATSRAGPFMSATEAPEEAAAIKFPAPLSGAEQLARAATFWSRAVPVMVSYMRVYAGLQLRERLLGQCLSNDECEVVWDEEHEKGAATLADAINDLKGFYVKTGQIIASRQDLFPSQYIDRLAGLTDLLDPMPTPLVRAVICQELLLEGESFEDVFVEFDNAPLGAASVAQVHRAVLSPRYGGGEVAVKVQRPAIEAKLMGDIAALKALAYQVRQAGAGVMPAPRWPTLPSARGPHPTLHPSLHTHPGAQVSPPPTAPTPLYPIPPQFRGVEPPHPALQIPHLSRPILIPRCAVWRPYPFPHPLLIARCVVWGPYPFPHPIIILRCVVWRPSRSTTSWSSLSSRRSWPTSSTSSRRRWPWSASGTRWPRDPTGNPAHPQWPLRDPSLASSPVGCW